MPDTVAERRRGVEYWVPTLEPRQLWVKPRAARTGKNLALKLHANRSMARAYVHEALDRALGQAVIATDDAGPVSIEDQWRVVRSDGRSVQERLEALTELVSATPKASADFISSELARPLDSAWHRALVMLAERVDTTDPSTREKLMGALRAHALLFRDALDVDADPPLWAALRRYSSLVPIGGVTSFLDFLRPEDRQKTKQTALQGLQNVLSSESLPDGERTAVLRGRIAELASKHLDPDLLGSPENAAMALNCFCAAVLAQADIEQVTDRFLALNRVGLIAAARRILERARKSGANSSALDRVLGLLSRAPTA
jgi:hypothetical protein